MSESTRTVITSPAVDVIHADIEFHIGGGKVRFVMVKAKDTLTIQQASAIAECVRVPLEDDQ